MEFVILTGLSGAGKTQAMHSMEDIGFFCVDNLPPALIPVFYDLCAKSEAVQVIFHGYGDPEDGGQAL